MVKDPKDTANNSGDSLEEPLEPPSSGVCSTSEPPSSGEVPLGERPVLDVPALAVRCDGRVLLSTVDLTDVDLSAREIWVGLVLTEAEASDIHDRLDFEQAASPTVARLIAQSKKSKKKSDDDDDDDA